MDNPDTLQILASQVDIGTIEALSGTHVWSTLRSFASDQYFWYQRTEFLLESNLLSRQGDWKTAYYALEDAMKQINKFTDAVLASTLAVQVLFEMGTNPSLDRNLAIRTACSRGYTDVVAMLLTDPRVEPSVSASYCIRVACEKGHSAIVELLLADGRSDPAAHESYSIIIASEKGFLDVVSLLIKDTRADPSARGNEAVIIAQFNNRLDILEVLLSDDRVVLRD
ncbi:Hypothetical protein POVR2_LOCUS124 [uncultured virus]|nr:Hypothetical protein POVR2_LOCUS124 [uncultured virus]